ncbi:hypothetical protein [Brevibacillus humidisoli]|nr:hypothetical protein [Brevibacillus humidisoli]
MLAIASVSKRAVWLGILGIAAVAGAILLLTGGITSSPKPKLG